MRLALAVLAIATPLLLGFAITTVAEDDPPPADPPEFDPVVDELMDKAASDDSAVRRQALDDLLRRKKDHINGMVVGMLSETKDEGVALDALRALGLHKVVAAAEAAIERLTDRKPMVRTFAAVCLERLESTEAKKPLLKRVGKEKDPLALKNALRALGVTGQGEADASAALVKRFSYKENIVAANAVLAACSFKEEGRVRSALANKVGSLLSRTSDIRIRSACLYTLGHIGTKRELPALDKFKKGLRGSGNPLAQLAIGVADIVIEQIETGGTDEFSGQGMEQVFRTASDDERDPARDGDPEKEISPWLDGGGYPGGGGGRGGGGRR